ncbi:MAG: hypothetical protein J5I47_05605 [Vicingus serpentipes]|nr:hypothetical protein [Vicingus serpentipes]
MCFSATASFGAGAIISVIGIAAIRKTERPSQLAFASIPLLFAFQQISEGFVWLSLTHPSYSFLQGIATYIFLFFAQIVWPLWVPLSIIMLKKKEKRKTIEKVLVIIGAIVSLYLGYCLLSFDVQAKAIGNHIVYKQDYPKIISTYGGALYLIATVAPPFFSDIKRMWFLGSAILISYIITAIFYTDYIVSVWCFFASIISMIVLAVMYELNPSPKILPSILP